MRATITGRHGLDYTATITWQPTWLTRMFGAKEKSQDFYGSRTVWRDVKTHRKLDAGFIEYRMIKELMRAEAEYDYRITKGLDLSYSIAASSRNVDDERNTE